jgi:glucosamine-6-phosphate deaminase
MQDQRQYDGTSTVESLALARTGRKLLYPPTEKIGVIEVDNFPLLGKLVALRFVEWASKNPGGVIALPTGRTPEHFIAWVRRILDGWDTEAIQQLLREYGVDSFPRPPMDTLAFVQIDEFYPMDAKQHNSFHYYVNEFYIKGFGLDPGKALLIDSTSLGLPPGTTMGSIFPDNVVDLTLRVRQARTGLEQLQKEAINRVDMFCTQYETTIRGMGGIGFFLGGIGPDGHIAFNVRGSSMFSVTRLTGTNYETQAAAASDLGGIEISRNRLVITLGLATITFNPTATAIIMAAGDAKAQVVRQAIEEQKHQQYPASALQDLRQARFYLTKGSSSLLSERRVVHFAAVPTPDAGMTDDIIISLSLRLRKPLLDLSREDLQSGRLSGELLLRWGGRIGEQIIDVHRRLLAKIERGVASVTQTTFLHTEPHQDDVMLGYLAYVYHLVRDPTNKHHFANLTSGFTSVSNRYCLSIVRKLEQRLQSGLFPGLLEEGFFNPDDPVGRMEDVYLFLDGTAERSDEKRDEAEARRLFRNLIGVYHTRDVAALRRHLAELDNYLVSQYPGARDRADVQFIKGTLREWEVELLWAYFGIEASDVHALRLGFYSGEIFPGEPQVARDVLPIRELISRIKPDIISVALDPEGSGPDTHYKALQAVAEAVKLYEKESGASSPRLWGYRNVWHRFRPAEASIMVPVSLNTLSLLQTSFMNCFGTQRAASFPSYEHDGPFSELAQKIQVEQYGAVKTCLGKDFFLKHPHPRLRAARGMIFLKEMTLPEFYERVRELRKVTEARE